MSTRKKFKFLKKHTVGQGTDNLRAKNGELSLPDSTHSLRRVEGHDPAKAKACLSPWIGITSLIQGIALDKMSHPELMHR